MRPPEGTRIFRDELKARWAFAELRTDRWHAAFSPFPPGLIRDGARFDELTADEKARLVLILGVYRKNLAAELDHADAYECQAWTREMFMRARTVLRMSPSRRENIPLLSFMACPRFETEWDPRIQADRIPFDAPFVQDEPVIVLPHAGIHILLEGYLRGVLFLRSPDPDLRILVWTPVGKPAPLQP